MTVICITLYLSNLLLEYVMHVNEHYYILTYVYARALALCSGVDLVALLWRTCVTYCFLKTLNLLAAFLVPCLQMHRYPLLCCATTPHTCHSAYTCTEFSDHICQVSPDKLHSETINTHRQTHICKLLPDSVFEHLLL